MLQRTGRKKGRRYIKALQYAAKGGIAAILKGANIVMKRKLTMKETIVVASTLFGMFFGAGNLIFPVHLGQLAGSNSWPAIIGFIITAVSIPILAVAALGNTHSSDLLQLSSKVSGWRRTVRS